MSTSPRTLSPRIGLALGAFALAAGCASVMDNKTVSRMAPDWFAAKSKEVKGQGYPKLADVPATIPPPNDSAAMKTEATQLKAEAARLATDPQFATPVIDDEAVRANAAQLRALAEQGGQPPQPKPSATPTP